MNLVISFKANVINCNHFSSLLVVQRLEKQINSGISSQIEVYGGLQKR